MTDQTESTQPAVPLKAQALLAEVADSIKGSGAAVRKRLLDALVEREVSSRVSLLDSAIQKRQTLLDELKKIDRPDVETFDASGASASSSYSKDRIGAIKKAREALQKQEKAIEKALSDNDFSTLKQSASGGT